VVLRIGRPQLLYPDVLKRRANLVMQFFEQKTPMTISELLEQIEYLFGVIVSVNTMSRILRGLPGVKAVTGVPMERARVREHPERINAYYSNLKELMKNVPHILS
jgi:hypothetical protein